MVSSGDSVGDTSSLDGPDDTAFAVLRPALLGVAFFALFLLALYLLS